MELIFSLDQQILEGLYAMRDPAMVQALIWITELGSKIVIGGLALSIGLVLLLRGKLAYAAGLAVSVLGSAVAVLVLKEIVQRERPDTMFQAYLETGFSFPSGHAVLSFALYVFLAWLAWRYIPRTGGRVALVLATIALVGAIGFSRAYLGVHYASDVLGGFIIGGIFVWIATMTIRETQPLIERSRAS